MKKVMHPVLSCAEAMEWEKSLLAGEEKKEWRAMSSAGRKIGRAVLEDWRETRGQGTVANILVFAGKGHNAGDALIAAEEILRRHDSLRVAVVFVTGEIPNRPLVRRAWRNLQHAARERVEASALPADDSAGDWLEAKFGGIEWDVCIDGILGMQFRPPLRAPLDGVIGWVNRHPGIVLRAAVDLPSGIGDESAEEPFRADFTYMPGTVKRPVFLPDSAQWTGRLRYLDIGFFEQSGDLVATASGSGESGADIERKFVCPEILQPLFRLRDPLKHKKNYGHLFLLGGSRAMPGAVLMSVMAALRSGVGLVTGFVPESLVSAFAARVPEAMWVPLPETPEGGLSLNGLDHVLDHRFRPDALVLGPGMGTASETHSMAGGILAGIACPVLLDADGLTVDLVDAAAARQVEAPVLLTPHPGEFARVSGGTFAENGEEGLLEFCREKGVVAALKGPPFTRVTDGKVLLYCTTGGPVLARGGSGDVLSGLLGGLLAQGAGDPVEVAATGVFWHGAAADALARARGSTAVTVTGLLEFLDPRPGVENRR